MPRTSTGGSTGILRPNAARKKRRRVREQAEERERSLAVRNLSQYPRVLLPAPAAADAPTKFVHSRMVASAEPLTTTARADALVRLPPLNGCETNQFIWLCPPITEQLSQVLQDALSAMREFSERHGPIPHMVRIAEEVWNNELLHKREKRRRDGLV